MEDIFSIIWVAIVGTLTVLSAVNSKRKKRAKNTWRASQNTDQPNQHPRIESIKTRTSTIGNSPQANLPIQEDEIGITAAACTTGSIDTEAQNDTRAISAETFDARRAVIYAEILRPKFEE